MRRVCSSNDWKVFQYHIVAMTMRKLNSTVAESRVDVDIWIRHAVNMMRVHHCQVQHQKNMMTLSEGESIGDEIGAPRVMDNLQMQTCVQQSN